MEISSVAYKALKAVCFFLSKGSKVQCLIQTFISLTVYNVYRLSMQVINLCLLAQE